MGQRELSDLEFKILDFEKIWEVPSGAKEAAIEDVFDFSIIRYYQILNILLDSQAALEYSPIIVKNLRTLRSVRQEKRVAC